MSLFARWTSIALAASMALAIPATSHAQFGGLKKKMKDKIAGNPQPAAASSSGSSSDADAKARQDAWQHPVAITASSLDAFTKALKAEQAERAKYTSTPGTPLARWNDYQTSKAKCAADEANTDSAMSHLQQKMMAEAKPGHEAAIASLQDSMQKVISGGTARAQKCNALEKPTFTEQDYTAVHTQEDRESAVGAAASGMSPMVYARLKERVIAYVLLPSGWKANGYTPGELQTIDAHRADLKKMVDGKYDNTGNRRPVGI